MRDALSWGRATLGRSDGFSERLDRPFGAKSVWIIALIVMALIVSSCEALEIRADTESADDGRVGSTSVVDRIVDGDTLIVDGQRVRIIGVSAPEVDECYGTEATRGSTR